MSNVEKIQRLKELIQQHSAAVSFYFNKGGNQNGYVTMSDEFWEGIKAYGYTPEDVAVVYDELYRDMLGENYTWADWFRLYNSHKNDLLERYSASIYIPEFEQKALDVVKLVFVTANTSESEE